MASSNPGVSSQASSEKAKPQPKDLSHHFSTMANLQVESAISPYVAAISATVTNLGAGIPFPILFPIDSVEGAIATPTRFPLFPVSPLSPPSTEIQRFTIPKYSSATTGLIGTKDEVDLATALQYQSSTGYASLAAFINDFALNHQNQGKIPYANPGTLITGGGDDGFAKCFSTFASSGDNILMEEYVYFVARDSILTYGVGIVPVKLDDGGIEAAGLEHTLATWDEKKKGKKPHLLYTVTIGHVPTGSVTSLSRKKQIYKICQKHDIIILEDDPCWALQYDLLTTGTDFLARLVPSYLTIDTDGRVLGIQTFSKIITPGCRLGWIVAQPAFIKKLTYLTDRSTQNPSGFSEVVLAQMFKQWGVHGFVRWIDGLRINYQARRNLLCEALAEGRDVIVLSAKPVSVDGANKHKRKRSSGENMHLHPNPTPGTKIKIRIYDFTVPPAASFIWIRLNFASHPLYKSSKLSPSDLIQLLWKHLISPKYNLLTLPGNVFAATPEVEKEADEKGVGYIRLTFASVDVRDLRGAGEGFGEAVRTFWGGEGWDLSVLGEENEDEEGKERGRKMKRAVREHLSVKRLV